jgi:hypothetical protein
LRATLNSGVLPGVAASTSYTTLRAALQSQLQSLLMPLLSPALLFDNLFANQPTPDADNSNRQEHIFDGRGGNTRHRNELHKFGLPW